MPSSNEVLDRLIERKNINQLIEPEDILFAVSFTANISKENFVPIITLIQDKMIRKVLGRTLYNDLFAQWLTANKIADNLPDGTAGGINYKELYEYVKPALIWWSATEFIVSNHFKVTEKGVQKMYDKDTNSASIAEMQIIEARVRKNAEFYMEELSDYLKIFEDDTTFNDEATKEGGFFNGVYLPSRRKRSCKKWMF